MGFGLSKQVTINQRPKQKPRTTIIVFSKEDAELVLQAESLGTYLLYRDHDSDRLYLSVRSGEYVEHHRVNFEDNLYYMDNQPYPYLDSIVLYHERHKLNGTRLTHPAQLSARTVKNFTTKITARNGNLENAETFSLSSEASEETRIPGIEHTNEMVLGKNKISKSSGRLWMSGMQKSLKRMSVSEGSYDFGQSTVRAVWNGGNGHVPTVDSDSDELGDVTEYMFDTGQNVNSRDVAIEFNQSPGDVSAYDDVIQGDSEDEAEPVILFCSHL